MSDESLAPSGVKPEECISGLIDWWSSIPLEPNLEGSYYSVHVPDAPLTISSNMVTIRVPSCDDLISLADSYIKISLQILKADGATKIEDFKALGATQDSIGFITLPASSIFSSVQLRVNDTLLSDSYGCSHYSNYIQHIMNYNSDAIKSCLRLEGFYVTADNTAAIDASGAVTASDSPYKRLAALTKQSKIATFITAINHPLAHRAKCLPAQCPLSFDFVKSIPEFALWSNKALGEDRIYKIVDMKMYIKKI